LTKIISLLRIIKYNFMTTIRISSFFLLITLIASLESCSKKELPVLTTSPVTGITITSATGGGTVTDEGSSSVVSLGICWSTDPEPTVQDFKTSEMAGVTQFTSIMKGLMGGTKYYVRAYASNDAGIGYGNEVTFITL
jgi:hypothetical protein